MKKKRKMFLLKIILPLAILILIGAALFYFTSYGYEYCEYYPCFTSALAECRRAEFIDDDAEAVWRYRILGESDNKCAVQVTLLMLKEGTIEATRIEGKEMVCYLSNTEIESILTTERVEKPHSNLRICHGILKEEIQELIIRNLFGVVIENLGQVREETFRPI